MLATSDTKLHSPTAGANRYETAALASVAYFSSADNVVLCNGRDFPDALGAGVTLGYYGSPLRSMRRAPSRSRCTGTGMT